jgi:NTE family protein
MSFGHTDIVARHHNRIGFLLRRLENAPLLQVASMVCLCLLTSCAHYPLNPGIDRTDPFQIMREELNPSHRSDKLSVVLAFSGGGTRAAALSYGVLEALSEVTIPGEEVYTATEKFARHPLLGEVDAITSVSGGSFTAAYYGLYGSRIFKDFRERFLYRNVERDLLLALFNPYNAIRTFSPYYGRSDLAAEYYDRTLFDRKTLGDIRRQDTPYVAIQATDIVSGFNFPFTPYMFSLICADYDAYPVSRAVAASAAFPGPFTPIVLKNRSGTCGFPMEEWVQRALEEKETTSRAFAVAKKVRTYADTENKPYVHLLDGGVADNLGLRSSLEFIAGRGTRSFSDIGLDSAEKLLFVIVNASSKTKYSWGRLGKVPGLGGILSATSSVMVDSTNTDTLYLLHTYFRQWLKTHRENRPEGQVPELYFVVVEFDRLKDDRRREDFLRVPTSLSLPEHTVDELRAVARELLFESREFNRFVEDVGGILPAASE